MWYTWEIIERNNQVNQLSLRDMACCCRILSLKGIGGATILEKGENKDDIFYKNICRLPGGEQAGEPDEVKNAHRRHQARSSMKPQAAAFVRREKSRKSKPMGRSRAWHVYRLSLLGARRLLYMRES